MTRLSRTATACAMTGLLAFVVACGGGEQVPAVEGPTSPGLTVDATEMKYTPDKVAVAAGTVVVTMTNKGAVLHDLRIDKKPFVLEAPPGQTARSTINLTAGRYEIFCSLPGHKEAGMKGVLEVR